jgi:hypothetical protein
MGVTIPGTAPGTVAEAELAKGPYRAPRGRRFPASNGGRNRAAEPKSCATA